MRKAYVLPESHLAGGEETFANLGHGYYIYGLPGESIPWGSLFVNWHSCYIGRIN
jgi:hypothetical protein